MICEDGSMVSTAVKNSTFRSPTCFQKIGAIKEPVKKKNLKKKNLKESVKKSVEKVEKVALDFL